MKHRLRAGRRRIYNLAAPDTMAKEKSRREVGFHGKEADEGGRAF